jgi:hypothetical protein
VSLTSSARSRGRGRPAATRGAGRGSSAKSPVAAVRSRESIAQATAMQDGLLDAMRHMIWTYSPHLSEHLTSPLTVRTHLRKRWSAQRWAGPHSHGGSQGFKSPHLHPRKDPGHWPRRVAPAGAAPSRHGPPGSKRAATADETANRCSIAATMTQRSGTGLPDLPIMSPFPAVHRVAARPVLAGQVGCGVRLVVSCCAA